ncbi:hypothetical protein FE257_000804 [Aspergillus nanangensis]|uniref:Uncharacterized protein n=1 Tax=Aspergillus nanangensis TaxID=2582783 RepID=A0AAD4GR57_ASPNN|nr:hypothetical protein FE257_000804 [Aspergillus nanangensis]
MDKQGPNGVSGTSTPNNKDITPSDLATIQAQWTKIHNDTVRQIERVREQEQNMRNSQPISKPSSSSVN